MRAGGWPTLGSSAPGAAALRHKILDAMEERLAATLEQHALRQQEAWIELRRVGCMLDHLALWLFVLLPPLHLAAAQGLTQGAVQ
jgi:hypothetical protein